MSQTGSDSILGQFYVAFGQGAGTMRVQRTAIAAMRRRYLVNIETAPGPWEAVAANVLGLLAQVGRLAALTATQAGRTAISEADFKAAARLVESRVHQNPDHEGKLHAGRYCTFVDDEVETPAPASDAFDPQPVETPVRAAWPQASADGTKTRAH